MQRVVKHQGNVAIGIIRVQCNATDGMTTPVDRAMRLNPKSCWAVCSTRTVHQICVQYSYSYEHTSMLDLGHCTVGLALLLLR